MGWVREQGEPMSPKQTRKLVNVTQGRRGETMDGKLKTSLCPTDPRMKVQTVTGAN